LTIFLTAIQTGHAITANDVNLPSTSVYIEVFNGTQSYFITNLIGVPEGYDVANGTYIGWCVDSRTTMSRSPDIHEVRLFSSISPPDDLANENWDMVNYILNHKQGVKDDIQQAIWYFVSIMGNFTPTRTIAWAIVNDTLANGEGFVPDQGQTIAVICDPLIFSHQPDVQVSIIEATMPVLPEFQPAIILSAFMLLTAAAAILIRTKKKHIIY
jgi:hypothetical protein